MEQLLALLIVAYSAAANPADPADTLHYQIRIGENVVGHVATITSPEANATSRRHDRTEMIMAREGTRISFEEEVISLEDSAGRLLWFEVVRRGLGPSDWIDTLERIDDGWRRTRDRGGTPVVDTLSTGEPIGPVAVERMLADFPDSLRFVDLDPVEFAPRHVEARLLRREPPATNLETPVCAVYTVRDTDGEEELLQWRDEQGILWREEATDLGWVIERREIAHGGDGGVFEAMDWPGLVVEGRVPSAPPCRLTIHPLGEPPEADETPPFPNWPVQQVARDEETGVWRVDLESRPLPPTTGEDRRRWRDDPALAASLCPGLMIDSDAPEVIRFAENATTSAKTPTEEARALERAVHQRIEVRDLGTVFATASQTLNHRTGDCTEHAILLAACCRARGIPARLIAGIVPYGGRMQFHLWTEIYLGDWYELDATIGRGHRSACAVGLLRWDQPEEGMQDLAIRIQALIGRYRFVVSGGR